MIKRKRRTDDGGDSQRGEGGKKWYTEVVQCEEIEKAEEKRMVAVVREREEKKHPVSITKRRKGRER